MPSPKSSARRARWTNFATFIDSANTKAPIASGKAKQKRFDLRLVSLGLYCRHSRWPKCTLVRPDSAPLLSDLRDPSVLLGELDAVAANQVDQSRTTQRYGRSRLVVWPRR